MNIKNIKSNRQEVKQTRRAFLKLVGLGLGSLALASTGLSKLRGTNALFSDTESSYDNLFIAAPSEGYLLWVQTSLDDFAAGSRYLVNLFNPPGEVVLRSTRYVYAFRGGTTEFWRYDIETGTWYSAPSAPGITNPGSSLASNRLAYTQVGYYLYAFQGGTNAFWRYDIENARWDTLTSAPGTVGDGASLTIGYNGSVWAVYATQGGGSNAFWRYNIDTNDWTTLTPCSINIGEGSDTCCYNDTVAGEYFLYCTPGGGSNAFLRWNCSASVWENMSLLPFNITTCSSIVTGQRYIYATRGATYTDFAAFNLADLVWETRQSIPYPLGAGSCLTFCYTDHVLFLLQGGSKNFLRYNIDIDSWTTGISSIPEEYDGQTGVVVGAGGGLCPYYDNIAEIWHLYVMSGGGTNYFWKYHTPVDAILWEERAPIPGNVGEGGAIVNAGDSVYVLGGGNTNNFWKFNISTGTWSDATWNAANIAPASVTAGGAMCYDGSRYIYALRGGLTPDFWRYDTQIGIWADMYPLDLRQGTVGDGAALCFFNQQIYALVGGGFRFFYVYDITTNSWSTSRNFIENVGAGGALTVARSAGTYYIYGWSGAGTRSFARYNISTGLWQTMSLAPYDVGSGGALCTGEPRGYDGLSNAIYSLRGAGTREFCSYSTYSNKWEVDLTETPEDMAAGGTMSSTVGAFVLEGSLASQVYYKDKIDELEPVTPPDTLSWVQLAWDGSTPYSTGILFEVRGSDSFFQPADDTIPWTAVGNTSPVVFDPPRVNRYIQWRATLTTSLVRETPSLYDVRVYYE